MRASIPLRPKTQDLAFPRRRLLRRAAEHLRLQESHQHVDPDVVPDVAVAVNDRFRRLHDPVRRVVPGVRALADDEAVAVDGEADRALGRSGTALDGCGEVARRLRDARVLQIVAVQLADMADGADVDAALAADVRLRDAGAVEAAEAI